MTITTVAALVFGVATLCVIAFQVALGLGAPWGQYAMSGRYRTFPPPMRVAALIQAAVLALIGGIELSAAGVIVPTATDGLPWLIWVPVAVSAVSLVLNLITPSSAERRIWAPVAAVMLVSSLVVALNAG